MSNAEKDTFKSKINFGIDIALVLIIALCLIFLMYFANSKFNEIITSDREALLIEHDPNDPIHNILAEEIVEFRPDACKMIEVYNENYESILRVQFKKDDEHMSAPLTDYEDLIKLFEANEDGHTEIKIGDEDEDVYFRWTTTTDGERCLFIIYMSRPVVKHLWVFSVVCCFVMLLVMALLIRIYMHKHKQSMDYYAITSRNVSDAIFK